MQIWHPQPGERQSVCPHGCEVAQGREGGAKVCPRGWVAVWEGTRVLPPHNKSSTGWEKLWGLNSMGGERRLKGFDLLIDWHVTNSGEVLNLRDLSGPFHVK